MDGATFKRIHPQEFYRKFLAENVRPDGRDLWHVRPTSIHVDTLSTSTDASALIRVGRTTVMCGIKLELASPSLTNPKEGYLVPNVELPSMCSTRFRTGSARDNASQTLSAQVNSILTISRVVDLTSLCIKEGEVVWCLYVDIYCLSYDGNALDACVMAALSALKMTRIPTAIIDEESGPSPIMDYVKKTPLSLRCLPIPLSFGIFDHQYVIADPTHEEEELLTGIITVVIDELGCLFSVNKLGGSGLSEDALRRCIDIAKHHAKSCSKLIA